MKKIIICGHAGWGKDTVAEMISATVTGCNLIHTSLFTSVNIIFPALKDIYGYKTALECYNDRVAHRTKWFNLIAEYNTPDKARLVKAVLEISDIYIGIRKQEELDAVLAEGVSDTVIWVDASKRLPLESHLSMTVMRSPDFHVVNNNGTLNELTDSVMTVINKLELRG